MVHLPPLPGRPQPAAPPPQLAGTSRQQQMQQSRAPPPPTPEVGTEGVPGISIPRRAAGEAAQVPAAAAPAGLSSFKGSYGSLMDATGMGAFMDSTAHAGAQGEPLMSFGSMGQTAAFPRSLGPGGDFMMGTSLDIVGSPNWGDRMT